VVVTNKDRLVLRNRSLAVAGWVGIALVVVVPPAVVLWVYDWTWPTDDPNVGYALLGALVGVVALWLGTVRPRVVADSRGVLVMDPFVRSRRIAWGEIESVGVETALYEGVALTTVDGERVMPYALQSGFAFGLSRPGHRWATDLAAQLDALRTSRA
jgi:hypothetical protein